MTACIETARKVSWLLSFLAILVTTFSPCAISLKYLGDQQEEAQISVSKNAMTNNPLLLAENLVGTYQVWEMGQEE